MTSGRQNYRFGKPYKLFIWWTTTYWYTSDHTKHFNIWSHQPDTTHAMLQLSRYKHEEQNSTSQRHNFRLARSYVCMENVSGWLAHVHFTWTWKRWLAFTINLTNVANPTDKSFPCINLFLNYLSWSCLSRNRLRIVGQ